MGKICVLILSSALILAWLGIPVQVFAGETVLSSVLTPTTSEDTKLQRQTRSYYDQRYGAPWYDRLEYDRPSRCGRCDDRDDNDRPSRDRYDDDRRPSHRPTSGNRYDRNKNYENDEDDRHYNSNTNDKGNTQKNGTEQDSDSKPYNDDKDGRPSSGRRDKDRHRDRDDRYRNRNDDRDRYRPDYYDRFLRDPYRERGYERPYYDDPYYRERRPVYPYDRLDEGYAGRYDGYGYPGYRKPAAYEDRFDRGNGYDDLYGGYGPGVGRGPHDSFRPWDETYRGQAGWDAGGRGYYFASGRPEVPASSQYASYGSARPETSSGWQSVGYRDPNDYRGSSGYSQDPYRQDLSVGYARPSSGKWYSVRPYRDQSGVNRLDSKGSSKNQYNPRQQSPYGQSSLYDQNRNSGYGQGGVSSQNSGYAQNDAYSQYGGSSHDGGYGNGGASQNSGYGNGGSSQNSGYGGGSQNSGYGNGGSQNSGYGQDGGYGKVGAYGQNKDSYSQSSSTTPGTSYLYQREDELVTKKTEDSSETTKPSATT